MFKDRWQRDRNTTLQIGGSEARKRAFASWLVRLPSSLAKRITTASGVVQAGSPTSHGVGRESNHDGSTAHPPERSKEHQSNGPGGPTSGETRDGWEVSCNFPDQSLTRTGDLACCPGEALLWQPSGHPVARTGRRDEWAASRERPPGPLLGCPERSAKE